MTDPLRILFLNQGVIGTTVFGHAQVEAMLRIGVGELPDVDATFAHPPPWRLRERALARPLPGLGSHDLDLHQARWHAVEAIRGRRLLRTALRGGMPEVLHVNSHSLALGMVRTMRRIPTLLSLDVAIWEWAQMGIWREPRAWSRAAMAPVLAAERRALEAAARVVAWSEWSRRGAEAASPDARVVVLHPGIDLRRFSPAGRVEREPSAPLRLLFVGGRFTEKGGEDLLAAIAPLLDGRVELDVVTRAGIQERAGVRRHVLSGGDERLVELYRRADLLCLPTYGDTYPWVLSEAMACETAVLSTTVGGIPDLVGDAGILLTPGDVSGLRAAIESLLADEPRREAMARAGRERVERRFDARVQGAKLAALAREVVEPAA